MRMLMNNLDPAVAENPAELVVYGGVGRAARDWDSFDRIVASLKTLETHQTLLVQSGKPVGVFETHEQAPRVLIANSNLVPHWATLEHFSELDQRGLMMYGQMTAGSWIYIGSQGIVQGTFETFAEMSRQHFGGSPKGRWILTAGLGGMGGAHYRHYSAEEISPEDIFNMFFGMPPQGARGVDRAAVDLRRVVLLEAGVAREAAGADEEGSAEGWGCGAIGAWPLRASPLLFRTTRSRYTPGSPNTVLPV